MAKSRQTPPNQKRAPNQKKGIRNAAGPAASEFKLVPALTGVPGAVKRMLAYQIERAMAQSDLNRAKLAGLMGTSRAAVNRLLDPHNPSVTLQTIEKVSTILGKKLHIFLFDDERML